MSGCDSPSDRSTKTHISGECATAWEKYSVGQEGDPDAEFLNRIDRELVTACSREDWMQGEKHGRRGKGNLGSAAAERALAASLLREMCEGNSGARACKLPLPPVGEATLPTDPVPFSTTGPG